MEPTRHHLGRPLRWLLLLLVLPGAAAHADDVRPVSIQIKEQVPGDYLVQWQVPTVLPAGALPVPVLPDGCEARGQQSVVEQPGTWVLRRSYRCPDGIAGRNLGVDFPIANPSITTLIRLDLLSGDQLVHVLQPGEVSWQVPSSSGGSLPPSVQGVRRALLRGAGHLLEHWVHLMFLLAICLVAASAGSAGFSAAVRLVGGFSLGQLVGALVGVGIGLTAGRVPLELALSLAAVVLTRQALRALEFRRGTLSVVAAAGVLHGVGLAPLAATETGPAPTWLLVVAAVLGMDVLMLAGTGVAWFLGRLFTGPRRSAALKQATALALGGAGLATAFAIALIGPVDDADAVPRIMKLPDLRLASVDQPPIGSKRVAPSVPDAPIQSFLAIEAFEIRHEILLRAADLVIPLGLEGIEVLETEHQNEVKQGVVDFVTKHTSVVIDGKPTAPQVDRVDFLTVTPTGVLPRPTPIPEPLPTTWIGATLLYTTVRTPEEISLAWIPFPEIDGAIPTTVTDPEVSRTALLTSDESSFAWRNELSTEPAITLVAVAVEPVSFSLPLLSLALLVLTLVPLLRSLRGSHRTVAFALVRVGIALSLVASPMGRIAIAIPGSSGSSPSETQARSLLEGSLRNVYRALEFRDESAAYDRLAVSVTGETLSQVYLEHRRAMEMEERGGARARVEAVEVGEVRSVNPANGGGFDVEAVWTVGGTVTHFGHRHFRQNRYEALVTLVAEGRVWKIDSIEVLDEARLR